MRAFFLHLKRLHLQWQIQDTEQAIQWEKPFADLEGYSIKKLEDRLAALRVELALTYAIP